MKFDDIQPGMLVALNTGFDAKVYFVKSKDTPEQGMNVQLFYYLLDGSEAYVSPVHYSLLLHPTYRQVQLRLYELDDWYDRHQEYDGVACNAPVWTEYNALTTKLIELANMK